MHSNGLWKPLGFVLLLSGILLAMAGTALASQDPTGTWYQNRYIDGPGWEDRTNYVQSDQLVVNGKGFVLSILWVPETGEVFEDETEGSYNTRLIDGKIAMTTGHGSPVTETSDYFLFFGDKLYYDWAIYVRERRDPRGDFQIKGAWVTAEKALNLRSEPNSQAEVLWEIPHNELITVLGQQGDWSAVMLWAADQRHFGYVNSAFISFEEPAAMSAENMPAPPVAEASDAPAKEATNPLHLVGTWTGFYESPSMRFSYVLVLNRNGAGTISSTLHQNTIQKTDTFRAQDITYALNGGKIILQQSDGSPYFLELSSYGQSNEYPYELADYGTLLITMHSNATIALQRKDEGWLWPGPEVLRINSPMMKDRRLQGQGPKDHTGIDINNRIINGRDYGTAFDVVATRSGTVVEAVNVGQKNGTACLLAIEHTVKGQKYYSFYLHLESGSLKVKKGDYVIQGDVIAKAGTTGNSGGIHLHFSIFTGDDWSVIRKDRTNNKYLVNANPVDNSLIKASPGDKDELITQTYYDKPGIVYWTQQLP